MKNYFRSAILVFAAAFVAAFVPPGKKYIDPANMDFSVKPGNNFYLFANGNWIKRHPVPPSKTRWGSFDELREESLKRLRVLLEDAAANPKKDRLHQMIGDFYASGMDSVAIERKGYQPIEADLKHVDNINSPQDVVNEIEYLRL